MTIANDLNAADVTRAARPRMTEEEFVAWASRTTRRAEWVDGEVQVMNAVEYSHAELVSFLIQVLGPFAGHHRLGRAVGEPYQVRLPGHRRRRQPDLFLIPAAKASLVERMQFNGAPDLIVEVVSPDSQVRDRRTKFREYQAAGVAEYWLPDPTLRTFEAYALDAAGHYVRLPTTDAGRTYSTVLTGAFFDAAWLRQLHPPEDPLPVIAEMIAERARLPSSPPPADG